MSNRLLKLLLGLEILRMIYILLAYIKNSRGPRIDPCGTPHGIFVSLLESPYISRNADYEPQSFTEISETNAKNGVVPLSHKQCKTLFNDHTVRLKIMSLYIYKDLRLRMLV